MKIVSKGNLAKGRIAKAKDWFECRRLFFIASLIFLLLVILAGWLLIQVFHIHDKIGITTSRDAIDRVSLELEWFKAVLTLLGGSAIVVGAAFTWKQIKETQKRNTNDLFAKAIEHLGACDAHGQPALEIRLGGIFALERIARHSKEFHWPIMEILTGYVRHNSPLPSQRNTDEDNGFGEMPTLRPDIQAIMTVTARRNLNHEIGEDRMLDFRRTDLRHLELPEGVHFERANFYDSNLQSAWMVGVVLNRANLSNGILQGASLHQADLRGAYLKETVLSQAELPFADLTKASLDGAFLQRARLNGAILTEASLEKADLSSAILSGARFKHASLKQAILTGAELDGADLHEAFNLTQAQVDAANIDAKTKLPDGIVNRAVELKH